MDVTSQLRCWKVSVFASGETEHQLWVYNYPRVKGYSVSDFYENNQMSPLSGVLGCLLQEPGSLSWKQFSSEDGTCPAGCLPRAGSEAQGRRVWGWGGPA